MLTRIITCLCHPKRIGAFFKDKAWMVILTILLMLILYFGAAIAYDLQIDYFNEYDTRSITQLIVDNNTTNIQYDSEKKELNGDSVIIKTLNPYAENYYTLNFFPTSDVKYSKYVTIVFTKTDVSFYYGSFLLSNAKFSDAAIVNSYNLANIKNGSSSDTLAFEYQLSKLLDTCNMKYGLFYFANSAIRALIFYFAIVLLAFLSSRLYNPTIGAGVRFKLCLYSSLVFILFELLGVLFNASWLTWVGVAFAFIYSFMTFTHILKKKSV